MSFAFLLPIFCFLLFFFLFSLRDSDRDWRINFVRAALIWGLFVTFVTEIFSLFHLITFWGLFGFWLVVLVIGVTILIFKITNNQWHIKKIDLSKFKFSTFSLVSYIGVGAIVTMVGIIAISSPPNTFDSMTYHMSRVMHWMQNRSVENYPTHIRRQLYMQPWSEFAILQFQILSKTDRFANLIQWFSYLGSIIGVSVIAKKFDSNNKVQALSSIFCATLPMAILQGSSTQNDEVVGFWLVCLIVAYFELREKPNFERSIFTGISLGLAILTKATAYLYGLPFVLWFGINFIRKSKIKYLFVVFVVAFLFNIFLYYRNLVTFGNPIGIESNSETEAYPYANEVYSISSVTSNFIRNISLHMGTLYPDLDKEIESLFRGFHKNLGLSPDDQRTTWKGMNFYVVELNFHEDSSGNPAHLLLLSVAIVSLFFLRNSIIVKKYALSLILAFIIFCVYLRWQPWHSRLHLPLFVLWAPVWGYTFSKILRGVMIAHYTVVATLIVCSVPWVLKNSTRPILGDHSIFLTPRKEQYYSSGGSLFESYPAVVDYLDTETCSHIGMIIGTNHWEYPFWVSPDGEIKLDLQIDHVLVDNMSKKHAKDWMVIDPPCLIIDTINTGSDTIELGETEYHLAVSFNATSIYEEENQLNDVEGGLLVIENDKTIRRIACDPLSCNVFLPLIIR